MHRLFAIEPKAINNWADLRYALEKFGYSKGVLLARYPKTWMRLVMESCRQNNVGDVELKRIEEKLRQAQSDRSVRMGLPYNAENWLASAAQPEVMEKLDAVLVAEQANPPKLHRLAEADEALFESHRETQVKQQAQALADAARYTILNSDHLVLIDPYFVAKPKNIKVLEAMLAIASMENHRLQSICIVTSDKENPTDSQALLAQYSRALAAPLNEGYRFTISVLPKKTEAGDFHARYLLSAGCGLRFDKGFVEPEDRGEREHLTDIACLDAARHNELWQRYVADLDSNPQVVRAEIFY